MNPKGPRPILNDYSCSRLCSFYQVFLKFFNDEWMSCGNSYQDTWTVLLVTENTIRTQTGFVDALGRNSGAGKIYLNQLHSNKVIPMSEHQFVGFTGQSDRNVGFFQWKSSESNLIQRTQRFKNKVQRRYSLKSCRKLWRASCSTLTTLMKDCVGRTCS